MNEKPAHNATSEHIRARAGFMLNASRAVFGICPQLAAYFGNEFLTTFEESHAGIDVLRQMCPYCGVPLVDGKSVSKVTIKRTVVPGKEPKGRVAKGRKDRKSAASRSRDSSSALANSRGAKPRVIEVRADGQLPSQRSAISKRARTEARANQKNSVRYNCQMCHSQIVFAGASRTSLALAGLDKSPQKAVTKLASLSISKEPTAKAQPTEQPAQAVSRQTTAGPESSRGSDVAGPKGPAKDNKPVNVVAEKQTAKRKKHKSKLLAAVAENKKRAEAKKASAGNAFSLSDFLTNL
ncbi:hypothetical protein LPJ56_004918 [Coemansia sp. RSA 2599]|nr:hypothetical protein LPJ75_004807 [Coemansia sp. RSA 2598]KAJ1814209.1 hypothetical protein LPJ56_004918 [Coemansia sp. RSA 2599]